MKIGPVFNKQHILWTFWHYYSIFRQTKGEKNLCFLFSSSHCHKTWIYPYPTISTWSTIVPTHHWKINCSPVWLCQKAQIIQPARTKVWAQPAVSVLARSPGLDKFHRRALEPYCGIRSRSRQSMYNLLFTKFTFLLNWFWMGWYMPRRFRKEGKGFIFWFHKREKNNKGLKDQSPAFSLTYSPTLF